MPITNGINKMNTIATTLIVGTGSNTFVGVIDGGNLYFIKADYIIDAEIAMIKDYIPKYSIKTTLEQWMTGSFEPYHIAEII